MSLDGEVNSVGENIIALDWRTLTRKDTEQAALQTTAAEPFNNPECLQTLMLALKEKT